MKLLGRQNIFSKVKTHTVKTLIEKYAENRIGDEVGIRFRDAKDWNR